MSGVSASCSWGASLVFVGGEDAREEEGFARVVGDDGLAGLAAFEGGRAGVEAEVAFLLIGAVAFVAGGFEEGVDVFGEIDGGVQRAPGRHFAPAWLRLHTMRGAVSMGRRAGGALEASWT